MADVFTIIDHMKEKQPLVHNITNQVVVNFTANGLYAIGAMPVMANAVEEAGDMARHADALLLNIGTLTQSQVDAMISAGKAANENGIPVVLDPVGVGATPFRIEAAQTILNQVDVTVIRGNAGEIATLAGMSAKTKGVDAVSQGNNKDIAIRAARQLELPVIVTGESDVITDGVGGYLVNNGHSLLTKVTGTGCLLSSVTAAFLASSDSLIDAAASAVSYYGVAAEKAASKTSAPGSFQIAFLDALYQLTSEDVRAAASINTFDKEDA